MPMKFAFNDEKALEVLAFIANEKPGLTPLYVSKILFFAEKWHINRYGRPIIADTYIAMARGPVPSTVKNFIDANWDWVDRPQGYEDALNITVDHRRFRVVMPGPRKPKIAFLSETDMGCLREAINYCVNKTPDELSTITHFEKSWRNAHCQCSYGL